MTQKELTCRGLEGLASWGTTPLGRTEYYRTTPANSSPKFCWLNGKAQPGQHNGITDVRFQNAPTCPTSWSQLENNRLVRTRPLAAFRTGLNSSDGQSTAHGCSVPWLAFPATDLRSASWYSPSRALSRPEIPLLWFICSKTASPFGSPKLTRPSPTAVAKL